VYKIENIPLNLQTPISKMEVRTVTPDKIGSIILIVFVFVLLPAKQCKIYSYSAKLISYDYIVQSSNS
jgi:hypothetical protein